jgi:hypothetical protein
MFCTAQPKVSRPPPNPPCSTVLCRPNNPQVRSSVDTDDDRTLEALLTFDATRFMESSYVQAVGFERAHDVAKSATGTLV